MALIPRKKKVKDESSGNGNKSDAQWDVYNDRQEFHLILNGRDISDRVKVEFADEGEMVIFDPELSMYFFLKGIDEVPESEMQITKGIIAPEGVACISIDGLKTYYCFCQGENISNNTDSFWMKDDLGIWIPDLGKYVLLRYSQNPIDNELLIPQVLEIDNGTLWYKNGEGSFWLYVNGEGIASHCKNSWVGDDLLLYDYEGGDWYYFVNYDTANPFALYKAAILPVKGKNLWTRTSDDNRYMFYKEGNNISKNTRALTFDDDMIIFVDEDNAHYLMQNFKRVDKYNLYEPILLPNNTDAIWRKPNNKEFYLYVRGQNISSEVTPRMMDGNLLLLHRPSKTIYICTGFNEGPIDEFLPAATMEAGDFLHYFN